ncbi:MAG: peptidoglycan DD-metalloendopeptidase family protein [Candidatus Omnitrophica bacterium]|nr:peptidoglycan DD-metalloendopeptidase family protein [Candidatus Omnitrophota bacterium]MCF7893833.1 peptidoglycan DD-metalloendopeptidase family protein [Candidatus Omnitrophota bacterium]
MLIFVSCTPQKNYSKVLNIKDPSNRKIFHRVKKGDSLWSISRHYNVSIKKIMNVNKISSPKNLKVSEKLIIPIGIDKNSNFLWPAQGEIVGFYSQKIDKVSNKGIDIRLGENTDILASNTGKVIFSDNLGGWNKTIILQHPNDLYTVYANLGKIVVSPNQNIRKGQIIANCGSPETKIVHFEIRKDYIAKNPLNYLN